MNGWMFAICLAVSPLNGDVCTRLEQYVYAKKEDCVREQASQADPVIRHSEWAGKCQPVKLKNPSSK
jgi:hypothetical protein